MVEKIAFLYYTTRLATSFNKLARNGSKYLLPYSREVCTSNFRNTDAPIIYNSFPKSDQALFETALLQACDALITRRNWE
jgi:hypothetical protein